MSATYTRVAADDCLPIFMQLFQLFGLDDLYKDDVPNEKLRVDFPNGVTLSIIWGQGTFCDSATVEVAVLGKGSKWLTQEVALAAFGEMPADIVDDYCDADRVHGYFIMAQNWKS